MSRHTPADRSRRFQEIRAERQLSVQRKREEEERRRAIFAPTLTTDELEAGREEAARIRAAPRGPTFQQAAEGFSERITEPRLDESPLRARLKGALGGAAEGLAVARENPLGIILETAPSLMKLLGQQTEEVAAPRLDRSVREAQRATLGPALKESAARTLANPAGAVSLLFPALRGLKAPQAAIQTGDQAFRAISALFAGRGVGRAVGGVSEGDLGEVGRGAFEAAVGGLGTVGPRVGGRAGVRPGVRVPPAAEVASRRAGEASERATLAAQRAEATRLVEEAAELERPLVSGLRGSERAIATVEPPLPRAPQPHGPPIATGLPRTAPVPVVEPPLPPVSPRFGGPGAPSPVRPAPSPVPEPPVGAAPSPVRPLETLLRRQPAPRPQAAPGALLERLGVEEPGGFRRFLTERRGVERRVAEARVTREARLGELERRLGGDRRAVPPPEQIAQEVGQPARRLRPSGTGFRPTVESPAEAARIRQSVQDFPKATGAQAALGRPFRSARAEFRATGSPESKARMRALGRETKELERKLRRGQDVTDELGAIEATIPARLTAGFLGGTAGAFTGPEDQSITERLVRIGVGASAGIFTPEILRGANVARQAVSAPVARALGKSYPKPVSIGERIQQIRYFNMLSRPATILRASLGSVGGTTAAGLERAGEGLLQGNMFKTRQGLEILWTAVSESPGMWMKAIRNPTLIQIPGRIVDPARIPKGWLGAPTRLINAADVAGVHAMTKNGAYTVEEAARFTLAGSPTTDAGKRLVEFVNKTWQAQVVVPFPRVGVQIVERGLERSPLAELGRLVNFPGAQNLNAEASKALRLIRQLEGAGIGIVSALGAEKLAEAFGFEPQAFAPFVIALSGPGALESATGIGLRELFDRRRATGEGFGPLDVGRSIAQTAIGETPLVGGPRFSVGSLETQLFSPGILSDVARATDVPREQRGEPLGQLRSRIPGLRQQLPEAPIRRDVLGENLRPAPETTGERLRMFMAQPRGVTPQERIPEDDPLIQRLIDEVPAIEGIADVGEILSPPRLPEFTNRTGDTVLLPPEKEEIFFEATGTSLRALLERQLGSAQFQATPPGEQAAILQETAARARKLITDRARRELRGDGSFDLEELLEPVRRLRPLR